MRWPTPGPGPACRPPSRASPTAPGWPALARFVDGIVVAVERGTPLAEVLRAQAQDVREERASRGHGAGGRRKEIAMMVPVVFLVLPVTVVFAVYPGFTFLRFTL